MTRRIVWTVALVTAIAGCGQDKTPAQGPDVTAPAAAAQPVVVTPQALPERVLFGDLHIHTSYSPDAFAVGNRTAPEDAYRFARGEQTLHAAGYPIRLHRPLDFAAVTDHAEYMGILPQLADPKSPLAELPLAKKIVSGDPAQAQAALSEVIGTLNSGKPLAALMDPALNRSVWQKILQAAERFNEPGRFSTLVGYEWTSTIDGANLHRNVLFRTARIPDQPFTSFDSPDPEKLWAWLESQRARGIESIAVPHNQNASDGRMFGTTSYDGRPFDADYVARRLRNEPVHEIIQIKGQSEVHPELAPADEFAQFEIFPLTLKMADTMTFSKPSGSYVREALGVGLELGASGVGNPYRFGFIGSSDSHNSSSPVEEDNYHGKLPMIDGTPEQRLDVKPVSPRHRGIPKLFSAQGLAAVWATENTRESIFDALRRGETYATSGTRISLRVFAGWDLEEALLADPDYLRKAYTRGVPMGSDLPAKPAGGTGAPRLLIRAARDPEGANLDRLQVVKGWLGPDGKHLEKVFDVAWSGDRAPDPGTGKLPPVGNTVDVATATWSNSIGAAELGVLWSDPEFDPASPAFYYVRVLEIPTPRWTTYDAERIHVMAPDPQTIQERAYSSPIWYAAGP